MFKYFCFIFILLLSKAYPHIEAFPDGTSIEYKISPEGQVESITSSDGSIHRTFTYDAFCRLISASSNDSSFVRSFTEDSQIEQEIWDTNLSIRKEYQQGLLKSLSIADSHQTELAYLDDNLHSFSINGKVIPIDCVQELISSFPIEETYSEGLIKSITFNGKTTQYNYDEHNRLIGENNTFYQRPETNHFHQPTETESAQYEYDVRGRLIAKHQGAFATYYRYNTLSELIAVESPTLLIELYYDPLGRRIKKTTFDKLSLENTEEHYIYDGMWEVASLDRNGNLNELRIFPDGNPLNPLAIELNAELYFPITTHQGHTLAMLDIKGELHIANDFNAFGQQNSDLLHPWSYTGHRYDPELSLYYFGKRYYDPELLAWTTPDPLGPIDSTNLYLYMMNNPLSYTDLHGDFVIAIPLGIGLFELGKLAIAGALAGYAAYQIYQNEAHLRELERAAYRHSYDESRPEDYSRLKKNDGTPTNNSDQNKQAKDARKEIEKDLGRELTKDEKRKFHDHISGQGYDYHEIVEEGYWLFHGK